jgi:hypothetical protein
VVFGLNDPRPRYSFSHTELRIGAVIESGYSFDNSTESIAKLKDIEVRRVGTDYIVLVWIDDPRLDVDGPFHLVDERNGVSLREMYSQRIGWDLYREWQREQAEFSEWKRMKAS